MVYIDPPKKSFFRAKESTQAEKTIAYRICFHLETFIVALLCYNICHGLNVGGSLENVSIDLNQGGLGLSMRGYSASAHASVSPIDNVTLTARVGYTDVDELNGMEYEVGAHYAINKQVTGFVEYRMANLDDEGFFLGDVDLDTLRIGARYNF